MCPECHNAETPGTILLLDNFCPVLKSLTNVESWFFWWSSQHVTRACCSDLLRPGSTSLLHQTWEHSTATPGCQLLHTTLCPGSAFLPWDTERGLCAPYTDSKGWQLLLSSNLLHLRQLSAVSKIPTRKSLQHRVGSGEGGQGDYHSFHLFQMTSSCDS